MHEIGHFVFCIVDLNLPWWPGKIYQKKKDKYQVFLYGEVKDKWKWINDQNITNFENMTLQTFESRMKKLNLNENLLKTLKNAITEAERDRELQIEMKNNDNEELLPMNLDDPSRIKDPLEDIGSRTYWKDLKFSSFFNFQETISKIEKKKD